VPGERFCGFPLEAGSNVSIYLHGERSGGVAEPILYDPRVNTGKYQGRGVSVSEMVQLDGRCFGPFGYPRKGMGDGIGIGGIPELVGKYQILIPVCASETQNVLGLSSSVVAQQCDGVRVESDPATPCGCLGRIEYNAAPCEPLGGLNDRHDRPVQIDVPPPQSESF